nr:ribonuclease H-like domain-containing protein [Tanacetum cinerariifolium]
MKDSKSLLQFVEKSLEVLDQTFDMLQKLISQLDIHGESISHEDVNLKFLRRLSPEWNTHTIMWRNKPEIEEMDLRWQMAMLTMKARGLLNNTGRKFSMNGKEAIRYNVVPPPYTGNFLLLKPDLSGLVKFDNEPIVSEPTVKKPAVETSEAKASAEKPKDVRKNFGPPIIEDWISDSEDEAESKPKIEKKTVKSSFAKIEFVKSKEQVKTPRKTTVKQGNPQMDLQDKVIDSRCSRHMTGNMSYLSDYKEIDGGYVTFGGNLKGGKITGRGTIKTGKLDFENVYFVRELKFNIFSVSQMCDKKNSVLFNDTECFVLSLNFKLTDESHVLLKVPRKNNMYSVDSNNIVPKGNLTCLFAKATFNESKLWHRRL